MDIQIPIEIALRQVFSDHGVPETQLRLLDLRPASFDEDAGTVIATLSRGSPVKRIYGVEQLEISKRAIDLSRLGPDVAGIPLLDSHRQDSITSIVGRIVRAWIEGGALLAKLMFAETQQGIRAKEMVARSEISSVSIGYQVEKWTITDRDGKEVDQKAAAWDDDLTFTATRWALIEASLVSVPADPQAVMRNFDQVYAPQILQETLVRMQCRHALTTGVCDDRNIAPWSIFTIDNIKERVACRQRMFEHRCELFGERRMQDRRLIFYR
jgi:Caudovirus prohead serine protease